MDSKSYRTALSFILVLACTVAPGLADDASRAWTSRIVDFENRDARLVGTLILPEGEAPHPLLVFVHGAGDVGRNWYLRFAEPLIEGGYAVLLYDKRGCGDSGGKFVRNGETTRRNLELLASDAAAAVEAMAQREEIDPKRIGLWGISQAGWVVPIAVEMSKKISFTILFSGPVISTGEDGIYSKMTNDGFISPRPSPYSQEHVERTIDEQQPFGFDPVPYLERSKTPGLWLFARDDRSIPAKKSIANLQRLIDKKKRPYTMNVFKGANHVLQHDTGPMDPEKPADGEFVPGVWEAQLEWLERHAR